MQIGIMGEGAIGRYVGQALARRGQGPGVILRRAAATEASDGVPRINEVADLPEMTGLMIDCAGHAALVQHGAAILERGIPLITLSLGALADDALRDHLAEAARRGLVQLHLASGAIGGLDALRAAAEGGLDEVTYVGRKPPGGWRGSPAEARLDLDRLTAPGTHFEGTAREAATAYPKNANVAAAVALSGPGFDTTRVKLIADPGISANIHEVHASGAFGRFSFRIEGRALPDNPRSSALAAMSALAAVARHADAITA